MKIRFRCFCRDPREVTLRRFRSNAAKQVHTPKISRRRLRNRVTPRNSHPDRQSLSIQFGGSLKARNEVPIGFSSGWRPDDSEIDPFTRRRSFKLKIARGIRKVRREKDLTHVTVPEPQRLLINPRIFRG